MGWYQFHSTWAFAPLSWIVLKGGWLIGTLSEEALESNNVCQAIPVRIFKEDFTCSAT